MSISSWTGAVSSDWADVGNWDAGVPDASSDVVIPTGTTDAVASASIGTVNSITDSSNLSFESAGTNTVSASLDDSGRLQIDDKAGAGGTILNIGGALTDSGSLTIGNASLAASDKVTAASFDDTTAGKIYLTGSGANLALLDVTDSAGFGTAGVLSGRVGLVGDSAIEFTSGEITSLAANAQLHINGNDAFIEDSAGLGSNSALTGLASVGAGAIFGLHNRAALSTSGSLVNDGRIRLDFLGGDGGSSLTVEGTLTNNWGLRIGNATLSASDQVTAASLDNAGTINLIGSGANQALLEVTGGAGFGTAGVLSGKVQLAGDSAIEFASGQITGLAAHAHLLLNGNDAFVEDSNALGSNSALAGLASIGSKAKLELDNGAAVSTTGALANSGYIYLDTYGGDGGSSLTVGGELTNSFDLICVNNRASASDVVTAASLDNTGLINLTGSKADPVLVEIGTSAGFGKIGVLSGDVLLQNSAIEFAGGQITSVTGELVLAGKDAFIEDSAKPGSNSALTGLSSVSGSLNLVGGASVSTTGGLANSGYVALGDGGPGSLTVGGALTNSGYLSLGGTTSQASSGTVSTTALTNTGSIVLYAGCKISVSGATINDGSVSISSDTEEFAGTVGGKGYFNLSNANLQFDSSVSVNQNIREGGKDALTLEEAQSFAGKISGFGTGDTIDAANFLLSGTTFNFVENSRGKGGTLSLNDGSLTANIHMIGDYSNSSFALAPDSGTGTLVKFV